MTGLTHTRSCLPTSCFMGKHIDASSVWEYEMAV